MPGLNGKGVPGTVELAGGRRLVAAVALAALSLLFVQSRTEAWLQAGLAGAALAAVTQFVA